MLRRDLTRHRKRGGTSATLARVAPFVIAAVLLHLLLAAVAEQAPGWPKPKDANTRRPIHLTVISQEEEPEALVEPERPEKDLDGQLVELAPPEEPEKPDEADYLAEHDHKVEEETRTERFKINPEVLAPTFSEEQKAEQEDIDDMQMDKPSTGAQVGNERFDPKEQGTLSALPSPWTQTNRDGFQDPVPSSASYNQLSGAPQNDMLDEKIGDAVQLNAKEYLYTSYLMRIRRLVNFYWEQNLDNLPPGVRLGKSAYTTRVETILDADGGLDLIEITTESGSPELDDCVVRAFRIASPFPNPPEGLIEPDGRVYLPSMSFTVRLGAQRMQFQGVDPRAGVQFPGILKAPR